jgi:hypothetical protein
MAQGVIKINGYSYEIRTNEAPQAAWNRKGYSVAIRALGPGQEVTLPISQATASSLAARVLGRGNYRTWRSATAGMTIWRRKE